MIRSLRQRHRRTLAVLGVILPLAFIGGIAARKPVPMSASLPVELSGNAAQFAATLWSRGDLFAKTPIKAALLRERADGGRFAIEFSAPRDFARPDLLVYWAVGKSSVSETIPNDAILLGGFNPSRPLLFPLATPPGGILIFYSLANHEVVDVSRPISF